VERPRPFQALRRRRWGWLDLLIVGPLAASALYYYVGLPLGQWLILHGQAITAELVRGSLASMILSGAQVRTGGAALWAALLAPLPVTMVTDPCCFYAGRRYGRALTDRLGRTDPRWRRRLARGERIYARFAGWAVLLAPVIWLPNAVFYFLAGETRMRFTTFILLDLTGQLLFIAEIVALGYFIGKPAEDLASSLSQYSLWIVLGTVAGAVALSTLNAMRQQRARG
jgi:membrane protein DedA with SNARE-associated domain